MQNAGCSLLITMFMCKGRLNVTCQARVLSVWSNSGVLLLDEERPQIAPVMGSRDSNSGILSIGLDGIEPRIYLEKEPLYSLL